MMESRRAASARSARSSCQERVADRSTRTCSTSLRGWSSVAQASRRSWNAPASSPGRTSVLASRPCLSALNFERSLPSGVLGPVLLRALRRLASARFDEVVVCGHGGIGPWCGSGGKVHPCDRVRDGPAASLIKPYTQDDLKKGPRSCINLRKWDRFSDRDLPRMARRAPPRFDQSGFSARGWPGGAKCGTCGGLAFPDG